MGPWIKTSVVMITLFLICRADLLPSCGHFHFPTARSNVIRVKENSKMTVPFRVNYTNCDPPDNFALRVAKESAGKLEPQCTLRHIKGECMPPAGRSKCTCGSSTEPYLLSHTVGLSDGWPPTEWVWSSDDDTISPTTIRLDLVCGDFSFPSHRGRVLEAEEGDSVIMPFKVNLDDCPRNISFVLQVTKSASQDSLQCSLQYTAGHCVESSGPQRCWCAREAGLHYLNYTADRSDNPPTVWTWSTDTGDLAEAQIAFDVLYPVTIRDLTIGSKHHVPPFGEGSSVDVTCTYDEGNPPVTARLLDRHGVKVEGSIYSSGQIRYTFPAVGCQDAGLIRCEAPGASQIKTALLLVKCVPEVQHVVSKDYSDGTVDMTLAVRSHSQRITCKFRKLRTELDCQTVEVTGTPPDLVLAIQLQNVTSLDEIEGWLDLTNDAGTGHFAMSEKKSESQFSIDESFWKLMAVAVVGLVVFGVCFAVYRECRKSKCRSTTRFQPPEEQRLEERRHQVAPEDHVSNQSVHYYFEVPDSPPPSDDGFPSDELLPPPPPLPPPICHGPGNPPDNYLSPSPSRDEEEDEGSEFNTVPFYSNTQLRNLDLESFEKLSKISSDGSDMAVCSGTAVCDGVHQETGASDDVLLTESPSDGHSETEYVPYCPQVYENVQK